MQFDVILADPPYNIGKDFGNSSDMRSLESYVEWSRQWTAGAIEHLSENGVMYIYGVPEILAHIAVQFPVSQQRWLVWHYTNKATPKSRFWQRSHESILCVWRGALPPKLNIDAIRTPYTPTYRRIIGTTRKSTVGRYNRQGRTTIYGGHPKGALPRDVIQVPALAGGAGNVERWFYCNTCADAFPATERNDHTEHSTFTHPTQKPARLTELLYRAVIDLDAPLDAPLDAVDSTQDVPRIFIPFAGSGAECVVAKRLGIPFAAVELNPDYVTLGRGWLAKTQTATPALSEAETTESS